MRMLVSVALLAFGCNDTGSSGVDEDPGETSGSVPTLPGLTSGPTSGGGGGGSTSVSADCTPPDPHDAVVPGAEPDDEDIDGAYTIHYVPDDPKAIVWFFHGSGGEANQIVRTEQMSLTNLLVPAGIGYVSTDSANRTTGGWNSSANSGNEDFVRLYAIRDHLIETTGLTEDTPIITMGFSNGGSMAATVAAVAPEDGWNVVAASIHNSGMGRSNALQVPTLHSSTENDDTVGPSTLRNDYERQINAGLPSVLHEGFEEPLHPERFARIGGGYSRDVSQDAFDEMVDMAMVDADGARLVSISDAQSVLDSYEANATVGQGPANVVAQMKVVWQMHRFSAQFNGEECQFISDVLDESIWGVE